MKIVDDKLLEATGESVEYIKQYSTRQINLLKLELAERTAKVVSSIATSVILGLIGVLILLFASITLALALGSWLESNVLGFGIVTLIYIVVGVIINWKKRQIVSNPVLEAMIQKLFD